MSNLLVLLSVNNKVFVAFVQWSSVKDTLDLFIHKPFDFLFAGEYIPLPVRQEARQEAVAKGYIKGVASDFNMPSKEPSYTS